MLIDHIERLFAAAGMRINGIHAKHGLNKAGPGTADGANGADPVNFLEEADTGRGVRFPRWLRRYMTWVLPAIVVVIYLKGYWDMFAGKGAGYLIPWMALAAAFLALIGWMVFGKKKA